MFDHDESIIFFSEVNIKKSITTRHNSENDPISDGVLIIKWISETNEQIINFDWTEHEKFPSQRKIRTH